MLQNIELISNIRQIVHAGCGIATIAFRVPIHIRRFGLYLLFFFRYQKHFCHTERDVDDDQPSLH